MKENNKSESDTINTNEKQYNKASLMNVKSKHIQQNVFSYLKVNHATKLVKYNKILAQNVLEGYFAESAASCSYYDHFRYMFFVEQNTEIIYQICNDIFKKDLEQVPKDLINGLKLKLKQNINNHNNLDDNNLDDRINRILFACAVPKIIDDIYSIGRMHFNNLSNEDLDKVKDLDSDKALQTLIETILEKMGHRRTERLDYLGKFLDEDGDEIINRMYCSVECLSLDDYEQQFRHAVYYKIVCKLIDKIQNEIFSKNHVNKYESFHHSTGNSQIFISINKLDCYSSECHRNNPACLLSSMASMYIIEYYQKLALYGCLDILFDGVNNASKCDQILKSDSYLEGYLYNWSNFDPHNDLREKLAMSYQRALMRIFNNNKEKFVEHCENRMFYDIYLSSNIMRTKFWPYWRLAGYIAFWILQFILGAVSPPMGIGALFWFAFAHHIFWLKIVSFIATPIFTGLLPFLISSFIDSIRQFYDGRVTISKAKYDNYLKQKYPILRTENEDKVLSDNYYKFREFKTKIINLNRLHELHKSVNKMFQNENQIPPETNTDEMKTNIEQDGTLK